MLPVVAVLLPRRSPHPVEGARGLSQVNLGATLWLALTFAIRLAVLFIPFRELTPESIYTWMRGHQAHELLIRLGTRELNLTHDAYDALPPTRAVAHLREILTHHGILEERDRRW